MAFASVEATIQIDKTERFKLLGGAHETNQWRKLNLIIDSKGDHFRLKVQTNQPDLFDPFEDTWEDDIPLTASQLWGAVQSCRAAWHDGAVYAARNGGLPLQEGWDLSAGQDFTMSLLGPLAVAGSSLFQSIFFPSKAIADPATYVRLRRIGEVLRDRSAKGSLWMRATSDQFYAPWNLIYSHELKDKVEGTDARPDGFWGYQHLIEHVPARAGSLTNEFAFKENEPLRVALQWDENIDSTLNVPCNKPVTDLLESYDDQFLKHIPRASRIEFAKALANDALQDHVLYFCCHAQVEGDKEPRIDESYMALTDRANHITPRAIEHWMGESSCFRRGPIVFLNTCQSAQMNSVFYQGFAPTFLNRKASAVIGTQTEIPAVFAGEFARRFLEEFFKGGGLGADGKPQRQVGSILWLLRREFLDKYYNPLGLLYSIYRGADVFLPKPLPKKPLN